MNEMLRMRIACLNKPLLTLGMEVTDRRLIKSSAWVDFFNELQSINDIILRSYLASSEPVELP